MNEDALAWSLLVQLEAYRRRDPQRQLIAGQIDLQTFLGQCQSSVEAYRAVAHALAAQGLIGEPSIDQLSIDNGGVYITGAGSKHLSELRGELFARVTKKLPQVDDVSVEIVKRGWVSFERDGKWPEYKSIEKGVTLAMPPKTDIFKAIRNMPSWVGNVAVGAGNSPIYIRLLGVVSCVGADSAVVLEDFWRAFTLARYLFHQSGDLADGKLSSGTLGGSGQDGTLGMTNTEIRQTWDLLNTERILNGGGMTDNETTYGWEYDISPRVHDHRDTATLEEYLQARINEDLPELDSRATQPRPAPFQTPDPDKRKVFVIHGRDSEARKAIFSFLKDLDLHPIEWEELVARTGQASPYTGEVVAKAFAEAQAVIALLTPDDEVRLHQTLWSDDEDEAEKQIQGQPRPNVYFEAGMAFNAQPERTILVEIGRIKTASDLHGRNVLRFSASGAQASVLALFQRLQSAGCAVDQSNPGWMDPQRFATLGTHSRSKSITSQDPQSLPIGTILSKAPAKSKPGLRVKLYDRGDANYLLEVMNSGSVELREVHWTFKEDVPNWSIMDSVLPKYPIPELPPREYVRIPVAVTLGGPPMVELLTTGQTPDGEIVEVKALLSVYG